jgi:hypothetical protein
VTTSELRRAEEARRLGVTIEELSVAERVERAFTNDGERWDGGLAELEASYMRHVVGSVEPTVGRMSPRTLAKLKGKFQAQQRFNATRIGSLYMPGNSGLKFHNAIIVGDSAAADDVVVWEVD